MNILIIEDSQNIAHLIKVSLETYRYNITTDTSMFFSKNLVKKGLFNNIIIGTQLEKDNIDEIIEYIHKYSPNTKILGISSKGSWESKVNFLKRGGDDVISYPFPIQELYARLQALNRRPKNYLDSQVYIGNFVLDMDTKCVYKGEIDIDLRLKEFELLEYLVRNQGRAVSRCELLDHVWDYRQYRGSNTVDVHVKRVRDKLEDNNMIQTVRGVGYKIDNTFKKSPTTTS